MDWTELFQIIAAVIISVGGAGAIIWASSSFLGNLWANKYLESIKTENKKQIEYYKNNLEILKEASNRYYGSQFTLYNGIYGKLYELKISADQLWDKADSKNLNNFFKKLKETSDIVQKNSLIIEDEHFYQLNSLFQTFSEFEIRKRTLVEIFSGNALIGPEMDFEIQRLIEQNREIKRQYDDLLLELRLNFKNQIYHRQL